MVFVSARWTDRQTGLGDPDPCENGDQRMTQWNRVAPEMASIHEFGGDMPTELIQLEALSFQASGWLIFCGFTPSYVAYMAGNPIPGDPGDAGAGDVGRGPAADGTAELPSVPASGRRS